MPARTRKRKASEEEDTTPEIVPAVKKTSRAPRKSQKSSQEQPSRAGKSSKKGRSGSSETLNPTRASKKTKSASSSVSTAKRDIRRKADEFIHLIYNQSKDGLGNVGSSTSTIESKRAVPSNDAVDSKLDSVGRNLIYQTCCTSLQNLQEDVDEFEQVNRISIDMATPTTGKQWKEDAKDITKVDQKAMEILLKTLDSIVFSAINADSFRSPVHSGGGVEQAARRWLQAGIPVKEETWGNAAREAFKALSGIAKFLS